MSDRPIILWFRRDLRLGDHPALDAAAASGAPIVPVYVLDDDTPGAWRLGGASRWWLGGSLRALDAELRARGSRLVLRRGESGAVLPELARETDADTVHFTRGYEPFMSPLEARLQAALADAGVGCRRFGGHVLLEPEAVRNKSGEPFKVFTPFYKACQTREPPLRPLSAPKRLRAPNQWPASETLASWRLEPAEPNWAAEMGKAWMPGEAGAATRLHGFIADALADYGTNRNRPDLDGTSRLSPHLTFGEISPRQIWHAVSHAAEADSAGLPGATAYIRELYWREFSWHLLFHRPDLPDAPFRPEFAALPWKKDAAALKAWQTGRTGYPIVDAGLRQLWAIGWMHNRVRMVVASFLTKHLLIPWQEGEAWFWDTLVDADLANNAASWQWVAGSGADAAPYFRVFNPTLQGQKFDAQGDYVRRWVPELANMPAQHIHAPWDAPADILRRAGVALGETYPRPIIAHDEGRRQALAAYEAVKSAGGG
jgi:deoxyribodipyrimidine photo-lyase